MAPYGGSVWAIEIGNESLKALRLGSAGQNVQVLGFANLSYGKILSGSGLSESERDELIALTLRRFMRENNIGKDDVIISVPSESSFARFVNLPPVEEKKIPQVVRLEAGMQIPFDMSEVQWDWQLMGEPGEGEARVGIFAIKNEIVNKELEYFGNEDVPVRAVQMVPMALYNYVLYDRPELVKNDKQAVAIINIGTEATDLVICGKEMVWQRCVPMGGNAFTRAIAKAFKLNFTKAEKLKRTAAMSKYARQVFQAMRPVFSDFASEIQRSFGFYSSSQPDCKVTHIIAMGGGTKLRGLLKYLQQTLQIPIEKPDTFKRMVMADDVSAAEFGENVGEFGVVYGLGLQQLGEGRIESNLLPRAIASSMAWASKARYFTYAAVLLLVVGLFSIGRTVFDSAQYKAQADARRKITNIVRDAQDAQNKLLSQQRREQDSMSIIEEVYKPFEYRELIPKVVETALSVMPNEKNNPQQAMLYEAFEDGDLATVMQVPRDQRKQMFITSMQVYYSTDLANAVFGQPQKVRQSSSVSVSRPSGSVSGGRPGGSVPIGPGGSVSRGRPGGSVPIGPREESRTLDPDRMEQNAEPTSRRGFVVMLTGYTPYEDVRQLLDPSDVQNDQDKWGVVTRLMNLDAVCDANCPFELFKKTDVGHFELETGPVGFEESMPEGIGVKKEIETDQGRKAALIDPMTKEIISRVAATDEQGREKLDIRGRKVYEVNDHWFVLKFKLLWKAENGDELVEDV